MSRWNPMSREEARAARLAAKARYRAKPGTLEKERETRKVYLSKPEIRQRVYEQHLARKGKLHLSVPFQQRQSIRDLRNAELNRLASLLSGQHLSRRSLNTKLSGAKKRFNITTEKYFALLSGGCWAGTNGFAEDCYGDLCIDHDHRCCSTPGRSCGECVRGVLCNFHNQRLGAYEKHQAWTEAYLNVYANKIRREV